MSQSNECLLNNALDDDFQKMLTPYYFTQRLLYAAKYRIKDNFVLPNSKAYWAINVFVLAFLTYSHVTVSLNSSCTIGTQCPLISGINYLIAHFVTTACVVFQTSSSVELLIRMQRIDKKLKLFGVTNLPYFVARNCCSIIFVLFITVSGTLLTILNTDSFPWIISVAMVLAVIFDLDMLHATCIIEFLSSRLECFLELFNAYDENPLHVPIERNSGKTLKDLFAIAKEILQAFISSTYLLQYWILNTIISTFIQSLMTVLTIIELTKDTKGFGIYKDPLSEYVAVGIWLIKNFVIVSIFSVACERFYYGLDKIKSDCAAILESYPEKSEYKKTAKNTLRLCDVRDYKMRVCGLFAVDAALPLRLMALVATYCIVLLQFAFL